MKRRRHNPEQIIRKLRSAKQLLNQGQTIAALIVQLAPRKADWLHRLVRTYQWAHVA